MTERTLGAHRVGVAFNPTRSTAVAAIKRQAAALIDAIERIDARGSQEIVRLKALAMTDVESAAMWAVKAATHPHRAAP